MKAILSDIHSNLEALKAVLEDADDRSITEIICLGDIIGYGPDPIECLQIAQEKFSLTIRGNHEEATLTGPENFNFRAAAAIRWTRERIDRSPTPEARRNLNYVENLPEQISDNGILMVHGTPRGPTGDYLFPRDIRDKIKMEEVFAKIDNYCFAGHSHIPGVFTQSGRYEHPTEMTMEGIYILDDEKALINVGSVGQPRDIDPRACYCTFDGDSVVFRRVIYDYEATMRRIYANERLDNSLGDRLAEGR
ncbi:MAG: metallophosphoesterase family protein [Planctomycetes bacterium]|nr:metallophosphoesterase family protein [Planctomycetota bacterium]